nr:MAG TPA: hypothetical protein [Caudoviricetes sp.]
MPTSPTKTVYKQYISTFVDVERHRWALLITYPDTEATRSYPDIQVVTPELNYRHLMQAPDIPRRHREV